MFILLRIIIISLILYFLFRIFKSVKSIFSSNQTTFESEKHTRKSKYNIDKNDIIEAKFEDITNKESNKTKANS